MISTDLSSEIAAYDLGKRDACRNKKTDFSESKDCDQLMKLIDKIQINEVRDKEKSFEQFLSIVDTYQEQSHLIDPFLPKLFGKLIDLIKQNIETNDALINESFKYMYCLTKMKGFKKIVQYLPHEINDLEPVLNLLRQDMKDPRAWNTRFMLLIWLSTTCTIPFDLNHFNESHQTAILNRLLDICTPYLFANDKCQDASAYLLGKFMSRSDLRSTIFPQFFVQLFQMTKEEKRSENNIKLLGVLKCLSSIYKYGTREELIKYALETLNTFVSLDLLATSQISLIRKFHVKIVQRVGITLFKTRVAKWRQEKVLIEEVNRIEPNKEIEKKEEEEIEDDKNIPEGIEEVIKQLLNGLKDKETSVRWSAAKGVGRIMNCLPREKAHDLLLLVLDLFKYEDDDQAWHGGCLTIDELVKDGLLLPEQLESVVPVVVKALVFDIKIDNYSMGRNVRDSACHVCRSLAKAFESDVLKLYANQIASALLVVSIFDREVNCRRAAIDAFKENVGKQGHFQHGNEILTKCDYYAVGQLNNCYLNLSVFIGEFEEYRQHIVDHLLQYKFNHWDQQIRELTSKALFNLTRLCPDYMALKVIPQLLRHSSDNDLNSRHGFILSLAETLHALGDHNPIRNFNDETIAEINGVIIKLFDNKYFSGSGGEMMRPAVCFFIRKLSMSRLYESDSNSGLKLNVEFLDQCEEFLKQSIEYVKEDIRLTAAETIPFYCDLRYSFEKCTQFGDNLISSYLNQLKTSRKESVRSGYSLAVGHLPEYLLENSDHFESIARALIEASKSTSGSIGETKPEPVQPMKKTPNENSWVQARRDSIKGLANLFKLIKTKDHLNSFKITNELLLDVIECYFNGLNDYTIDSKGDSGSRVREASLEGLEAFILMCATYRKDEITKNAQLITSVLGKIIQQSTERIDRTRSLAGKAFANLIHSDVLDLNYLPYITLVRSIFKKSTCKILNWNGAPSTFSLFVKLLSVNEFQTSLLTGIIYSIGGLTESLVKSATSSFLKKLKEIFADKIKFKSIIEQILHLCQHHLSNDRLATPLIKAVDLIIQNGFMNDDLIKKDNLTVKFLNEFLKNIKVTKDIQKFIAYTDLFTDMLQFEEERIRERLMNQLMIMLCHSYPRVRKIVADKLFEALVTYSEMFDSDEDNEECTRLLTETDWSQAIEIIRPIRNRICDLTKTPIPVLTKPASVDKS